MKLVARGAEAEILLDDKNVIHKRRLRKFYRHPELDIVLRTERNKKECNILERARKAGLPVPKIVKQEEYSLQIEYISGQKIAQMGTSSPISIAKPLGEIIAKMHDENIIHGDLTTSNMILRTAENDGQRSEVQSEKLKDT